MKIINKGAVSDIKRFRCDNCGTVFDADKDEYTIGNHGGAFHEVGEAGIYIKYRSVCPVCGEYVGIFGWWKGKMQKEHRGRHYSTESNR